MLFLSFLVKRVEVYEKMVEVCSRTKSALNDAEPVNTWNFLSVVFYINK